MKKTFTVEGLHWHKDVVIDTVVFEKEQDMGFEAMTQAMESFFVGEYEESFTGEPALGMFMSTYEKGKGHLKDSTQTALTESVLFNAGYDALAKQFREYAKKELKKTPPEEE